MRRWLLAAIVALGACGPQTPPNQPGLVSLSPQNLATFGARFDQAADRVRVVALLSPT